jgi:hypothetical protein
MSAWNRPQEAGQKILVNAGLWQEAVTQLDATNSHKGPEAARKAYAQNGL